MVDNLIAYAPLTSAFDFLITGLLAPALMFALLALLSRLQPALSARLASMLVLVLLVVLLLQMADISAYGLITGNKAAMVFKLQIAESTLAGDSEPLLRLDAYRGIHLLLFSIWTGGMGITLCRLLPGYLHSFSARSTTEPFSPEGLNQEHPVAVSQSARDAAALGWFRPRIVLPSAARHWQRDHLRAVLAHETSHIRDRDPLIRLLLQIICICFWFNPLIWKCATRVILLQEMKADLAATATGIRRSSYCAFLLSQVRHDGANMTSGLATNLSGSSRFVQRLEALLNNDSTTPSPQPTVAALLLLTCCLLLVATGDLVTYQSVHPEQAPTSTAVTPVEAEIEKRRLMELRAVEMRAAGRSNEEIKAALAELR